MLVALGGRARAAFDLETVATHARQLAQAPYDDSQRVPEWLTRISYDQWRDIRYRRDTALWKGLGPFTVQFIHPGLLYNRTVNVNVVDATGVHPVPFSPSHFDYGRNDFASRVPQDLGYAGFRIDYPIKTPTYQDEVIVFLGASYFRAVGRQEVFGLSARGLAIDTAVASGEEFPRFRELSLVRPAKGAKAMTILALLDSRRMTGAYRFDVQPGEQTVVKVDSRLFVREPVAKLGIAPLTRARARPASLYLQKVYDDEILAAGKDIGVPPVMIKQLIRYESQFWPVQWGPYHFGLGHLTSPGATEALFWNRALYEEILAESPGSAALPSSLLSLMNAYCPTCEYGLDIPKAEKSIRLIAQVLLAYCKQTTQIVYNATKVSPVDVVDYATIWKLTLLNYNAGPMCAYDAVKSNFSLGTKLSWVGSRTSSR